MTAINKWTWRGFSRWFKSGWRSFWPFADKLIEIAKPMLVGVYDDIVDGEQEKLIAVYKEKGLPALSKAFDALQKKICELLGNASIAPQSLRDRACDAVEDEGNKFQRTLMHLANNEGVAGVDKLIDAAQAAIRERLLSL